MTDMNRAWNSLGHLVAIPTDAGIEMRHVMGVRLTYGAAIQLRLSAPLVGCTSRLYTVTPDNVAGLTFTSTHLK